MQAIIDKAAKIKLLILDVDGVLTDGKLYIGNTGEAYKTFHVHDGLGIKLLQQTGVTVAVITSRESAIVKLRMQELGVQYIYQGYAAKFPVYQELIQQLQLTSEQVAYVGDDLPDLPVMRAAGLAIAVANASSHLLSHVHWQTKLSGGQGAVREVCELIMTAQNTFNKALNNYYAKIQ